MRGQLIQLQSIDELMSVAADWDDLWQRSSSTMPTMRAAFVREWCERFRPQAALRGLVVQHGERFIAGMILLSNSLGRVLTAGTLPSNEWIASGDLLIDGQADPDSTLDLLVAGLRDLPWPIVHLDEVPLDAPHCVSLLRALDRSSIRAAVRPRYRVGLIDSTGTWDDYAANLSKSHRRKMTKQMNRLRRDGNVELCVHEQPERDAVPQLLMTAFELEDRSWKGRAGSSVIRTAGMLELLSRQALRMLENDEFHLAFLKHDQRPIAFGYGWRAKGVLSTYKIGYDATYSSYGPGHLYRQALLQQFAERADVTTFDCLGPISDATLKWTTGTYRVGRILIGNGRLAGPGLIGLYKHVWPRVRQLKDAALSTAEK